MKVLNLQTMSIPVDETVKVLSLGAGVQSSTMCFAYERGILKDTLHRSCVPLDEVVFEPKKDDAIFGGFNQECEGMCGL